MLSQSKILVNVFDGGPRTVLEAWFSGCSPFAMKRELRPDPLTQDLFDQAGNTKKSWVRAEPSSHIWQADLPPYLNVGLHRLNVKVRNEYGVLHKAALIFDVVDA